MGLREYLNTNVFFIDESFDSKFKIKSKEKIDNSTTLYYFDIENKEYRIFIEKIESNIHFGFERLINNKWVINGVTNDLSQKDILTLFGTVKHIILMEKFKTLNVSTNEMKKYSLYKRMLEKLSSELSDEGYNFKLGSNKLFVFLYSEDEYLPPKFKYKKD